MHKNDKGVDYMERINKTYASEVKQLGSEADRILRFVTSTENIDRDGDILEINGWDLENYKRSPVILFGHDYQSLPVGKCISIYKDIENRRLVQDVMFPVKEDYEFADTVYRLARAGYLSSTSVGFIGSEAEPRLNEKGEYVGKRYKRMELLETSIVPVPSNPFATMMTEARSKGIINDEELKELTRKAVVPYKSYPTEPESATWDGPAEIAAASPEDLKIMSTWYDALNADAKGSYKLPHHRASDKHLIWRGVTAAMGALLGARGGVQIPANDKKGVYNHLARHYRDDFDKEPPEFKDYEEVELKAMFDIEEKAGASISAKNMAIMQACMDHMEACMTLMQAMMGTMEDEPMSEGMSANCTASASGATAKMTIDDLSRIIRREVEEKIKEDEYKEEIKSALDEIKSQVLLLSQKDAPKIIDLDAIEYTPLHKDATQDELSIEPEVLKNMIKEILNNELQGGIN